jgi:hypothetical protein
MGFLFSTFRVSRKNKFMLSYVRVQVHEECLTKIKEKNTNFQFVFCKPGKVQKAIFFEPA